MNKYTVTVPIVGVAHVEVEANSKEEAIREAIDACAFEHIEEWNPMKQIVTGNVFHGPCNRAEAIEDVE